MSELKEKITTLLEIYDSDKVANDTQVYELEKELSNNFDTDLSIDDKIEILKRAGYI